MGKIIKKMVIALKLCQYASQDASTKSSSLGVKAKLISESKAPYALLKRPENGDLLSQLKEGSQQGVKHIENQSVNEKQLGSIKTSGEQYIDQIKEIKKLSSEWVDYIVEIKNQHKLIGKANYSPPNTDEGLQALHDQLDILKSKTTNIQNKIVTLITRRTSEGYKFFSENVGDVFIEINSLLAGAYTDEDGTAMDTIKFRYLHKEEHKWMEDNFLKFWDFHKAITRQDKELNYLYKYDDTVGDDAWTSSGVYDFWDKSGGSEIVDLYKQLNKTSLAISDKFIDRSDRFIDQIKDYIARFKQDIKEELLAIGDLEIINATVNSRVGEIYGILSLDQATTCY